MICIGIDVSKGKSTICILKPQGEIVEKPFEITHNLQDLNALISRINAYSDECRVVLEATGHYHLPLLSYFQENNIFVSVINPMMLKRYASISIRKGKTDKLDAIKIARFGIEHWYELNNYRIEEDVYRELRLLSRQYFQVIGLRIKQKISLLNMIDETLPGIDKVFTSHPAIFTKDPIISFAARYWHYDRIKKMKYEKFKEGYEKWAKKEGYHFKEEKVKTLYTLAQNSITTLPSTMISTKMLIIEQCKIYFQISQSLSLILARLQELAKGLPEYKIVRSMHGVGDKLAPMLIAEIGDVRRFHSAKALVAYAGIDAPPYQSGKFTGTERSISKRGSRYLRKLGFETMKCIKCREPKEDTSVYDFIKKKDAEGKAKKQSLIAGLNKFLRIYYSRVLAVVNMST